MIETVIILAEVVAFAVIALHLIAEFVVSKPDSKIRASFEKILVAVIITGFCCLLYFVIRGIYYTTWLSYLLIALALLLLLVLREKYLRDLKEAATIIREKI